MKLGRFILVTIGFIISLQLSAQRNKSREVADYGTTGSVIPEKSFDFITQYNIEPGKFDYYKAIEDIHIYNHPSYRSGSYDAVIPRGTVVEVYGHLSRESFYIVHFDDTWGFVPATALIKKPDQKQWYHVSEVDTPPVLLNNPEKEYRRKNQNLPGGIVVLKIFISKTGKVIRTEVVQNDSNADHEALKIAENLRFKPAMHKGKLVDVFMNYTIDLSK
ncbi:MAG: hypothetical protein Kow00127_08950 [Bacteroidales bacterium]